MRFRELEKAFAVSAHVAVDFGQRGEVFAFGLADILSRDLRPSLCAPDVIRQQMYFSESSDMLLYLAGVNEHAVPRIVGSKRWSVAYFLRTIQCLFEYGVRF